VSVWAILVWVTSYPGRVPFAKGSHLGLCEPEVNEAPALFSNQGYPGFLGQPDDAGAFHPFASELCKLTQ
jgi:hypothetical protein